MPRSLARLLLALAALLLALGSVEAGVRLWAPQPPLAASTGANRGEWTTPGRYRHRTDEVDVTVQVNAQGYVDGPWGPRRPGVQRVLLLGDSFVQAAQVELEQGLGRQLDQRLPGAEVLSAGVPGAGAATALLLLQELGPSLQPDLVVWAMLSSNDVLNASPLLDGKPDKPYFGLEGDRLVRLPDAGPRAPLLLGWSHLARWAARVQAQRAEVAQKLAAGEGLPVDLRVHDPAGGAQWERAWAVTEALVQALAEESRRQGAELGVLVLPDQVVATRGGKAAAVQRWPQLASWDLEAAHRRSVALCARHAPTLDLLPALQAADGAEPLYLPQDGHWTARGHAVAAAAAADSVAGWLAAPE